MIEHLACNGAEQALVKGGAGAVKLGGKEPNGKKVDSTQDTKRLVSCRPRRLEASESRDDVGKVLLPLRSVERAGP